MYRPVGRGCRGAREDSSNQAVRPCSVLVGLATVAVRVFVFVGRLAVFDRCRSRIFTTRDNKKYCVIHVLVYRRVQCGQKTNQIKVLLRSVIRLVYRVL
jgi:hypothetical protein